MNRTETLAMKWLTSKGYTGIVFQNRKTPDFLTNEGDSFEIKKINNNTISIGHSQIDQMRSCKNAVILVFNGGDKPIAEIPFEELKQKPKIWEDITIRYGKYHKYASWQLQHHEELIARILPPGDYLSVKEASQISGIKGGMLNYYINKRRLKAVFYVGEWKIRRENLMSFISSQNRKSKGKKR